MMLNQHSSSYTIKVSHLVSWLCFTINQELQLLFVNQLRANFGLLIDLLSLILLKLLFKRREKNTMILWKKLKFLDACKNMKDKNWLMPSRSIGLKKMITL